MSLTKNHLLDTKIFDQHIAASIENPNADNTRTGEALKLFRQALKDGRERLKQHYIETGNAQDVISLHAWLVDQLVIRAWRLLLPLHAKGKKTALVAVGGYGRSELFPASDVDLMLLLEKNSHKSLQPFMQALLNLLWDMGLEVGHSVRSLKDCARESKKDITVATNLMEARLLQGDEGLFETLAKITGPKKLWPSKNFFAAKRQEQIERHHHFGDTAYNLEPNIKEGPGGLRDIQMIAWVTQRHFGTTTLHELVEHEFLNEAEYRALVRGKNLLGQIRCGLHYLADHREDRLLFDHQRNLAKQMEYEDKDGSLAVEQFMKHYYRTVKELARLNEILLQHFDEAILKSRRAKIKPINRRFQAHADLIEVTNKKVFERSPFAMLEMFLILQQHPKLKGVRASTIRLLRDNLTRIDQRFRKDIVARSLFMEIMRQPRGITHELRRMNAYGVLGAYIPAFGGIVGQMQHDLFHVYTVDEHTLFVLRNLRRLTVPEFQHEFPEASKIIQRLVKTERLYLAAIFHDIAKGRGGDHSLLGEKEAYEFCQLHDLSNYDARFVSWLVRNHLIMSWTAQRQDIHDPEVVLEFARKVGDQEHLDNLYLLTMADMRGTSPKVWNVWKERLLSQLYTATTRVLRRGFAQPLDEEQRISELKNEARKHLNLKAAQLSAVEKHWERMDNEYFLRHDAEALAWHAREIVSTPLENLPLVATRYHPGAGGTEFLIYTPDQDGLFVILTAGFDRLNLSIMDARIHTTRFGFALDTFVVLDHTGDPITDKQQLKHLQKTLHAQLLKPRPGRETKNIRLSRALNHFPIETRVGFSLSPNGQLTLMDVVAQDRPGLLYQVALALQTCEIRLLTAKVATYGERAEDILFITDRAGRPLSDPALLARLEAEVIGRLSPPADHAQTSKSGTHA